MTATSPIFVSSARSFRERVIPSSVVPNVIWHLSSLSGSSDEPPSSSISSALNADLLSSTPLYVHSAALYAAPFVMTSSRPDLVTFLLYLFAHSQFKVDSEHYPRYDHSMSVLDHASLQMLIIYRYTTHYEKNPYT